MAVLAATKGARKGLKQNHLNPKIAKWIPIVPALRKKKKPELKVRIKAL